VEKRKAYRILVRKTTKRPLEDQDVGGRMILKWRALVNTVMSFLVP
jgi:hypothetical protein